MKTNKMPLNMDERTMQIALRVMSVLYLLTIFAMQGIALYRQLVLGQSAEDFEDLAILMTINVICLVSALLYFGAVSIQRLRTRTILGIYVGLVVLGSGFTYTKYNLFGDANLTMDHLLGKFGIVAAILGLLLGFWIILSWIARYRMEKELED